MVQAKKHEGKIIFNSKFNRKKVVLKNRAQHFATDTNGAAAIDVLQKENKKLRKQLKKLAKKTK